MIIINLLPGSWLQISYKMGKWNEHIIICVRIIHVTTTEKTKRQRERERERNSQRRKANKFSQGCVCVYKVKY